eukprot:scaffold2656_cov365-Pavlova_lutheri.AAC.7
MIGDWFGPSAGRTDDPHMPVDSRLVPRLRAICERLGQQVCLYGDAAYPASEVLLRALKRPNTTPAMAEYATSMSSTRNVLNGSLERSAICGRS